MYMLPEPTFQEPPAHAMAMTNTETIELWHRRLARINSRHLPTLYEYIRGVPQLGPMKAVYRESRLGKPHELPFPEHSEHSEKIVDVVH